MYEFTTAFPLIVGKIRFDLSRFLYRRYRKCMRISNIRYTIALRITYVDFIAYEAGRHVTIRALRSSFHIKTNVSTYVHLVPRYGTYPCCNMLAEYSFAHVQRAAAFPRGVR